MNKQFLKKHKGKKFLPCVLDSSVSCSYRKSMESGVMQRCFRCSIYQKFMKKMDEEDREVDAEMEFIHTYGYEAFDREFKKKRKR